MPDIWKQSNREMSANDTVMNIKTGVIARLCYIEGDMAHVSPHHTRSGDKRDWKLSNVVPVYKAWSDEEPNLIDSYQARVHRETLARRKQADEDYEGFAVVAAVVSTLGMLLLAVMLS